MWMTNVMVQIIYLFSSYCDLRPSGTLDRRDLRLKFESGFLSSRLRLAREERSQPLRADQEGLNMQLPEYDWLKQHKWHSMRLNWLLKIRDRLLR